MLAKSESKYLGILSTSQAGFMNVLYIEMLRSQERHHIWVKILVRQKCEFANRHGSISVEMTTSFFRNRAA